MDIFELDTVKAEKAMAMRKYRMTHYVAKLFRFVEAFLLLFFLFPWFSSRLPAAARASGDFLVRFLHILSNPKFVFVVGNAIVITLIAKSGVFGSTCCLSGDLYDEFVRCSEYAHATGDSDDTTSMTTPPHPVEEMKETLWEDKFVSAELETTGDRSLVNRRSISEKQVNDRQISRGQLGRSETKKAPRVDEETDPSLSTWSYDESYVSILSNEEFQRTIDAFIERQIRFRRQEAMALVVHSHPNSDEQRSSSSSFP